MRHLWPVISLLSLITFLGGCRTYTESTPRQYLEGDDPGNYRRVFKEDTPPDVTVHHSVVVAYSFRLGVVTTDDFEFELVVPPAWVDGWKKSLHLQTTYLADIVARKNQPIRPWYAPKPITDYQAYRDLTSVGYLHLLVDKTPEPDGRLHVFFSKH